MKTWLVLLAIYNYIEREIVMFLISVTEADCELAFNMINIQRFYMHITLLP